MRVQALKLEPGDRVIVEADRGVDLGTYVRADLGMLAPQWRRPIRKILRLASRDEIAQQTRLRGDEAGALNTCRERVDLFALPMRVVDAEFQFDRNRVTFYFTADGRIDFRELVRDLAKIFRTRIELRQISPREAARRQGGVGPCGQTLCCARLLQPMEPVTLKMARQQNMALTPLRIAGMCGRLLCCISFGGECGAAPATEAAD